MLGYVSRMLEREERRSGWESERRQPRVTHKHDKRYLMRKWQGVSGQKCEQEEEEEDASSQHYVQDFL